MDLSMFLRGTNLLDEEARRHTSLVKALAPLPGRNFAFGVRAMF
jgi:iron complex outermembrane receptor protein